MRRTGKDRLRIVLGRALTAVAMTAMLVPLFGCGKKSDLSSDMTDLKNMTYEVVELKELKLEGDISSVYRLGDRIYVTTNKYEDLTDYPDDWVDGMPPEDAGEDAWEELEYKYRNNYECCSMDLECKDLKKILSFEIPSEEPSSIRDIIPTEDGKIYVIHSIYNETNDMNEFTVDVYDTDGNKKSDFSMTDILGELGEDVYVDYILAGKDGNLYFVCDQSIVAVDDQARSLFTIDEKNYINGATTDKDGNIIYMTRSDSGNILKKIDPEKKSAAVLSESAPGISGAMYSGAGEYDYFGENGSGLVGFKEDGSSRQILNWVGSNIESQYISKLTAIDDKTFMAYYSDYNSGEPGYLCKLVKMDPSAVEERVAITYGGMYLSDDLKSEAIKFNKSQNKYTIVFRDYSSEEDPEGKMNSDLLAGDVPDIIDMSNINVNRYIAKGLLADIYPLIDKDEELSRDDFIDNVLKAFETDGKLYFVTPYFGLNLLAGYKDDIGDKETLTIDDIMELEKKHKGSKAFSPWTSNASVITDLCYYNYDNYIDWTTGKCSFDSDEFVKTLEYAKEYPSDDEIEYDEEYDNVEYIRSHKQLFAEIWNMSFEEIEVYDALFEKNAAFVGYPSAGGGMGARAENVVGIYSKSPNIEGAWSFLRRTMTREYASGTSRSMSMSGFPLRKDSFEDFAKRYTTTKKYTDDFGNEIEPIDSGWSIGENLDVQIKPLTEDQMQIIRDIISRVDHRYDRITEIDDIISEETGALFSGQKDAKQVADIIQNRVTTYVNETK